VRYASSSTSTAGRRHLGPGAPEPARAPH
jgi:hypothetical protein